MFPLGMPCVIVGATRKAMSKQQTASIRIPTIVCLTELAEGGTVKCSINVVLIPPLDCTVDSVILHHHPS